MTIKEWINKHGLQVEVSELKKYQSVNISFINSDGRDDETQFDVENIISKSGVLEIAKLFHGFCKENGFKENTVTNVAVVASSDDKDEL